MLSADYCRCSVVLATTDIVQMLPYHRTPQLGLVCPKDSTSWSRQVITATAAVMDNDDDGGRWMVPEHPADQEQGKEQLFETRAIRTSRRQG